MLRRRSQPQRSPPLLHLAPTPKEPTFLTIITSRFTASREMRSRILGRTNYRNFSKKKMAVAGRTAGRGFGITISTPWVRSLSTCPGVWRGAASRERSWQQLEVPRSAHVFRNTLDSVDLSFMISSRCSGTHLENSSRQLDLITGTLLSSSCAHVFVCFLWRWGELRLYGHAYGYLYVRRGVYRYWIECRLEYIHCRTIHSSAFGQYTSFSPCSWLRKRAMETCITHLVKVCNNTMNVALKSVMPLVENTERCPSQPSQEQYFVLPHTPLRTVSYIIHEPLSIQKNK